MDVMMSWSRPLWNVYGQGGYDVLGAVELQEKFVQLSASRQADFLDNLFASHPLHPELRQTAPMQQILPRAKDTASATRLLLPS